MTKTRNKYTYFLKFVISHYKKYIVAIPILTVVYTFLTTVAVYFTKLIVDNLSVDNITHIDLSLILTIVIASAVIYLLSAFLNGVISIFLVKFSSKLTYKLRDALFKKMDIFTIAFFYENNAGNLISCFTNDTDIIGQNIGTVLYSIFNIVLSLLLFGAIVIISNPFVGGIIFISFMFATLLVFIYIRITQKYFDRQQDDLGLLTDYSEDFCYGLDVIQTIQHNEKIPNVVLNQVDNLAKSSHKSLFLGKFIYPLVDFLYYLFYLFFLIGGCMLILDSKSSAGEIVMFIQFLVLMFRQLFSLVNISTRFQYMLAAFKRLKIFFEFDKNEKHEYINCNLKERDEKSFQLDDKSENYIEFKNVHFSYNKDVTVLKNISFSIKKYSKVAFIGQTGCGKTTCTQLLTKLYQPNDGKVLFNGRDISTLNTQEFRNNFSVVSQNVWLFKGTIFDNIKFGSKYTKISDVISAAKKAHVHDYIMSLSGTYFYKLSEDASNISSGIKQLISIARAILQNRDIIIFDEATSSLDLSIENKINSTLYSSFDDKTIIMIAHKYTTIKQCDQIMYLNDGRIESSGTHAEMLEKSEYYKTMYKMQKRDKVRIAAEQLLIK